MEINKIKMKTLRDVLRPSILEAGYSEFRESYWGTIFCKLLPNGLFMTVALEKSDLYDFSWTASLYMGVTTNIGATFFDIPNDSYIRITRLLTNEEKILCRLEPVNDPWWSSLDESIVKAFKLALRLSEERLAADDTIIKAIHESTAAADLKERNNKVIDALLNYHDDYVCEYGPTKDYLGVPVRWYEAAEVALRDSSNVKEKYMKQYIIGTAMSAYREYMLKQNIY